MKRISMTAMILATLFLAGPSFGKTIHGTGWVKGTGVIHGSAVAKGSGSASGSGIVIYKRDGHLKYKRGTGTVTGYGVAIGRGSVVGEGKAAGHGWARGSGRYGKR